MEAGISAGQGRGESTGVFRGLTLKPLCFDEQGQNKYRIRQSGCPVHIIRLHAHPMPRRASQGVDRYRREYIQVPVLVLILPSTNTEYRRRRRQKQTATTRPGTSRQEAGRRSRTEVVRFPFAARLNELHRLRGCGWVWWRGQGLGKGARGAWKDFCPNHTPLPR
ncbi:hypothetical protein M431DRAFT_221752 [Trichoderma harzianum CBS 226.95]|uniref:Uncharacterized protein n=1 Tax=Trichoderma harzianum CBS 226.95 TaxID=983964 RepID=A0A2T4A3I7_TRIHA|nr:hypothetical protein M431DRAFT_221752 [Trichoderma harzianum CBS 226.95]PTB51543.1 hypothetical protein M431DRAFT_221752 [Trichoderma harzianum CBS 226.95]